MRPARAALPAALAALVLVLSGMGAVASARASSTMQTGLADDRLLLRNTSTVEKTARRLAALGVDSVRLHARWIAIAPRPGDRRPPAGFRAADPDDPHYAWAPLDRAVAALRANGIEPMPAVPGSGPLWASGAPSRRDPRYKPDPRRFGQFAEAVARRYAPAVSRYLVWNEPNVAGWLRPQQTCRRGRCVPASPALYRELFRAGAEAIRRGDAGAQVMIGTLAPRGTSPTSVNATVRPLAFIRALGCVTARYARDRTGSCRTARPIRADGFAYHPHPVRKAPDEAATNPDDAAIADLARLENVLDRTTAHGIMKPVHGRRFDLHLTEFGYQTNPPDRTVGISPTRQAEWVQHATFLAWRDPRVKTITQYELQDEPTSRSPNTGDRYAGWQSGLEDVRGRPKPLLAAFPNPFWIEVRPRRALARFWGQVRPGGAHAIHLQRRSGASWTTVATLQSNAAGYWTTQRAVRSPATYRFTWTEPPTALQGETVRFSRPQVVAPLRR